MEISGQILPNSTGELPGNPHIMGILRTATWCFYLRKHHRHWFLKIGISKSTLTPDISLISHSNLFTHLSFPLNVFGIWISLSIFTASDLVQALVISYLELLNSLLYSIPSTNLFFTSVYTPHCRVIVSEHYHGASWCLFFLELMLNY